MPNLQNKKAEKEMLKELRVFWGVGAEGFKSKNWEGVNVKMCMWSFKWKWLLSQLTTDTVECWLSITRLP